LDKVIAKCTGHQTDRQREVDEFFQDVKIPETGLTRYGIFSEFDPTMYRMNCIARCFRQSEIFGPEKLDL
jgi:hypothetical protein